MRHKQLKLSAILLLVLGLTGLQAQTILVNESTGAQAAYTLGDIQKMSFSSGNLAIIKTDGSSGLFTVNDIRNLIFSDNSTVSIHQLAVKNQSINAYPNPAINLLNIDLSGFSQLEGTLKIINFEGQTVISQPVIHAGVITLNISFLPKGIYLCHFINSTDIKSTIIIKQ